MELNRLVRTGKISMLTPIVVGAFVAWPVLANEAAPEKEIMLIEKALVDARSAEPVARYIDPDIVLYDLMPPTLNGISAWRNQMAGLTAHVKSFKVDIVKIDVKADREMAVANSEQHFTVLDEKGKSTMESDYRVTDCYHKVNGHWLLFSQHASYPVDMATGKAVFSSK